MNLKSSILFLFICLAGTIKGAVVDTIAIHCNTMDKKIETIIITPSKDKQPKPVVYLLHGHGGNAKDWLSIKPELKDISEHENIIFVCPDAKDSWYWDSPKDSSYRYETFFINELIPYIDAKYPTTKKRTARAITGLSMGGHGAIWLAFRHKDIFGAVGSTSGGLDIRPFPNNWEISKKLGKECDNQGVWDNHTAINQISLIKNGDLSIIIDCGYGDFFFEVNNDFHKKLLKYQINHDFLVRPGIHHRDYWKNSIDYHILFFKKYFTTQSAL